MGSRCGIKFVKISPLDQNESLITLIGIKRRFLSPTDDQARFVSTVNDHSESINADRAVDHVIVANESGGARQRKAAF